MSYSNWLLGTQWANAHLRSKAHNALTAPLVLHHTRIYKCTMKKFCFNCQMGNEPFLIAIYHSSLVKGAMNAARVCKLHNGDKKTPQFPYFFTGQTRNNDHSALVSCLGIEILKLR
jgi:hypothetical protein